MKYGKRYKRTMDVLEKLGTASVAVGIFQGKPWGTVLGLILIAISIIGTRED